MMTSSFRGRGLGGATKIFICALIPLLLDGQGAAHASLRSPAFVRPSITPYRHQLTSSSASHTIGARRPLILTATSSNDAGESKPKSARERGVYARPSAAIERGSGFFVPGLEGPRVRFISGVAVLLIDAASHVLGGSRPGDLGQLVAESIAAFYGMLLLLQGSVELGVERGLAVARGDDSAEVEYGDSPNSDYAGGNGMVANSLRGDDVAVAAIQRMAETIVTFTPATSFRYVEGDSGVLYSYGLGNGDTMAIDADEQKRLAKMALGAVSESKGGRVALPSDHAASKLLPEEATRSILVQRINGYKNESRGCVVIGSDKLLPSFTKNDLRWIGQLAEYNNLVQEKA